MVNWPNKFRRTNFSSAVFEKILVNNLILFHIALKVFNHELHEFSRINSCLMVTIIPHWHKYNFNSFQPNSHFLPTNIPLSINKTTTISHLRWCQSVTGDLSKT